MISTSIVQCPTRLHPADRPATHRTPRLVPIATERRPTPVLCALGVERAAYVLGLRAEGCTVPEDQVRCGHALCLLLMTGLSTMPFDLFNAPMAPETQRIAADRAVIARYALDLAEGIASSGTTT